MRIYIRWWIYSVCGSRLILSCWVNLCDCFLWLTPAIKSVRQFWHASRYYAAILWRRDDNCEEVFVWSTMVVRVNATASVAIRRWLLEMEALLWHVNKCVADINISIVPEPSCLLKTYMAGNFFIGEKILVNTLLGCCDAPKACHKKYHQKVDTSNCSALRHWDAKVVFAIVFF